MEELFGQIVLIIANSGIPVLLGNLAKHFFPKMDGKTGRVVNILTICLFVYAWFYREFYDPNFLIDILPGIEYKAREVVEILNGLIILIVSMGLNKPIYDHWIKGKAGLLGKSFSAK